MEIIIGREEGARRLHCIADGREFNVGAAGSVPTSVSRKHCRIVVLGEKMSIENLRDQNITYVDGNQVFSKSITSTSKVQLGSEKFAVPLQQILQLATGKPIASVNSSEKKPEPPTFSLRPMKSVWEEYNQKMLQIDIDNAKKQKEDKKKRNIQALCSSIGMLFVLVPDLGVMRYVLMGISALITVYIMFKGDDDDITVVKKNKLNEEYATKYKCPNPACGKPFGSVPYRSIEYNKQCFACGCKYTH
ncbi:MAG: FHA domain-containing protein [Prevotellaceae bacterium]|nr:FHA domain-containing protein [Candidatus Minthosoma equi]